MTRAEPGCTVLQKDSRSSKQASARGTSKRMSDEAYSMIFCTRAWQAGELISSLSPPCLSPLSKTLLAAWAECCCSARGLAQRRIIKGFTGLHCTPETHAIRSSGNTA